MSRRPATIELRTRVQRKQTDLCPFVEVPQAMLDAWSLDGTTVIEGHLDDTPLGRRTIKRWDDARWFIELPKALLQRAGVAVGQSVRLRIESADMSLPVELARLLAADRSAAAAWQALSAAARRTLAEPVHAAAGAATRERRARAVVVRLTAACARGP
jgi:antitoxin component of MazEF toxin-antitoxin module